MTVSAFEATALSNVQVQIRIFIYITVCSFILCYALLEYTDVTGIEALPLGSYFQDHVRSLILSDENKFWKQLVLLGNVVRQLGSVYHTKSHFFHFLY